jgi:HEAT repeat protein
MPFEQSLLLADFARTCKAAARAVSLYPGTHPAIGTSLSRLVASASRLARSGPVTFAVYRDLLAIDGQSPVRPDPSIGELATLLHERLIGRMTFEPGTGADDWRAFLLLLARSPDDLMAEGGIGQAWRTTGRAHFDIREIDYAEVLRERGGGDEAAWDRIIAHCLEGDGGTLDEGAMASLVDAVGDPGSFSRLVEQLQQTPGTGIRIGARIGALMQLMRTALAAASKNGDDVLERAVETIAASCARLTPEMMLAMLEHRQSSNRDDAALVSRVADHITDETAASFMARAVSADPAGAERLAQAIEALIPAEERKRRVVALAKEEALRGELGADAGFEEIWDNVANTVMSYSMIAYSDEAFVSKQYGRELTAARTQAIEVERVADDPPERVQAWVATVSDTALQQLDLAMLLDLLRIENGLAQWEPIALIAASEAERRTLTGDIAGAHSLLGAIAQEAKPDGRSALRAAASRIGETLCTGPLARHVALQFRSASDVDVERYNQLCQLLGPGLVRTLADALSREENPIAIRRLGEVILTFGAAGRRSVEHLKNSPNPAVRRTAITLLRRAGGQEALLELASMLGDADPEVQRESIHAIVAIGTTNAYSVLHRLLLESDTPRESALRELVGLRDDKAVPLFSYVITRSEPRGKLVSIHVSMIEALGTMRPRPESIRALQQVLLRGNWWAPLRTATLRQTAAVALRRIGTPEAMGALEAAANTGGRGVRKIARAQIALVPRRETSRA